MFTEIEWVQRKKAVRRELLIALAVNIMTVGLFVLLSKVRFPDMDMLIVGAQLVFVLIVINPVLFLVYRDMEKDLGDALNFCTVLEGDNKLDLYKSIVKQVEDYLVKNRLTFKTRLEGYKYEGSFLPYSKVFDIGTYGLALKVKHEKLGRSTNLARIILGPVSDPDDPVPRKLMNELRSELQRTLEKK